MSKSDNRARARAPQGLRLTTIGAKLDWYDFDPYYRDGCDDVRALTEAGCDVDLWNGSFIIFRPDAIVTRSVSRGVEVLRQNGFAILEIFEFRYTYLTVREGWRYQNNINTRDRLAAMDMLMTSTPSLLCLLRRSCDDELPASARLKLLKGPSTPSNRKPGQIRYEMSGPQASMLGFVHAPDEPADMLRELAIFLDPARRRHAYGLLVGERESMSKQEIESVVDRLYARTPAHDLCATSVLDALRSRGHSSATALDDPELGATRSFAETLASLGIDPDDNPLDAVAIAARMGRAHIEGCSPILPDADPFAWKALESTGDVGSVQIA